MLGDTSGYPERAEAADVASGLGGRFRVHERLDQGRFGSVYRAFDRQRTDRWGEPREVALLVLPREVAAAPARLAAFERAFEAVRRLEHPHIAAVHDLGREAGTYFMTMEFVDGEALRGVIDSLQPELVTRAEALEVVQSVGEALMYAHEAGVVHGDVRAENVVVAGRGEVKVLFSAACLSRSGPFSVDERDDIYGLAALAYELLSGSRPPPYLSTPARSGRRAAMPDRIKGLSRSQWRALRAGLKGRDERTRSVAQLLAGLDLRTGPRRWPRAATATRPQARNATGPSFARRAAGVLAAAALVALSVFAVLALGPSGIGSRATALYSRAAAAMDRYVVAPAARGAADLMRSSGSAKSPLPPPAARAATEDRASGAPTGEARRDTAADAPAPPAEAEREQAPAKGESGRSAVGASEPAGRAAAVPEGRPAVKSKAAAAPQTQRVESHPRAAPQEKPAHKAGPSEAAVAPASLPAPSQRVYFAATSIVTNEGDTVVPIEIRRDDARNAARIVWWTRSGTAKAGDDFGDVGRTVETFAPGQSRLTVFVPITDDAVPEPREHFYVNASLLSPSGRQQGHLLTAVVTIVDDDF